MNLPALRANWRTSLSGIGAALFAALTALSALPYTLGDIATIIPPEWKPVIFQVSLAATIVLKIINSVCAKDAGVTGNGTLFDPAKVAQSDGTNKVLAPLLALLLLPAGLLAADEPRVILATRDRSSEIGDRTASAPHLPSPISHLHFRVRLPDLRPDDPIPAPYFRTLFYEHKKIDPRVLLNGNVVAR